MVRLAGYPVARVVAFCGVEDAEGKRELVPFGVRRPAGMTVGDDASFVGMAIRRSYGCWGAIHLVG